VTEWLAQRGQRMTDFSRTVFYSDSRNDLPLLEAVSHPVAVSPDPTLRAVAESRGWPIVELFAA
jgi:phosphoserine phosphatase